MDHALPRSARSTFACLVLTARLDWFVAVEVACAR